MDNPHFQDLRDSDSYAHVGSSLAKRNAKRNKQQNAYVMLDDKSQLDGKESKKFHGLVDWIITENKNLKKKAGKFANDIKKLKKETGDIDTDTAYGRVKSAKADEKAARTSTSEAARTLGRAKKQLAGANKLLQNKVKVRKAAEKTAKKVKQLHEVRNNYRGYFKAVQESDAFINNRRIK